MSGAGHRVMETVGAAVSLGLLGTLGGSTVPDALAGPEPVWDTFLIPAAAEPHPGPDVLADIETWRQQHGLAPEDVPPSLLWQNDFAAALSAIQGAFPDSYTGGGIDNDQDLAWIAFAAAAPADLQHVLGELPCDVEVRQHLGWTEYGFTTYALALYRQVAARPEVGESAADLEVLTGQISIQIVPAADRSRVEAGATVLDELPAMERAALTDALAAASSPSQEQQIRDAAARATVVVRVVTELGGGPD